jgi:hypothetical protein
VIPSRNWKVDLIEESGDGVLYQDDCDFHKGVDIENSLKQKSFDDCVNHCLNVTQCTHFSYSSSNRMCSLKNAPLLTVREAVRDGTICGYIPRQRNLTLTNSLDNQTNTIHNKNGTNNSSNKYCS